jgi:hypothetical protein
MLCAHTIRRLKPGSYDEFVEKFMPTAEEAPAGWVRVHMLRSLADENEVISFGFFDGTLEDLERSQQDGGYEGLRDSIEPLVDSVVSNGVYEIVTSLTVEGAARS